MTFIRNPDDAAPFWRLNEEICLSVSRLDTCLARLDTGADWPKTGDPSLIRRWDNDLVDRLPDYPIKRPSDNPFAERPPAEDYFRRN